MSLQMRKPTLVIGIGGVGSKLATDAGDTLGSDCLIISNDVRDFAQDGQSIHVSTDSVINPSVRLIRGSAYKVADQIRSEIAGYSTVVMMSNMAGKAGAAMAPVVSQICKESGKELISFAVMPFKYEKDRIFDSGVSLKRVRKNSQCTIVLDNDSLLESNPDLSPKSCYEIANSAIRHVIRSLRSTEMPSETSILTTGRHGQDIEESLRDSLKMLYGNTSPSAVKRSMLYVVGGENIPVGVLGSITSLAGGIVNEDDSQIEVMSSTDESRVVMLSSVQGMTKFDKYDPLGVISQEDTLDWDMPDCSIDCKLDLYQLE